MKLKRVTISGFKSFADRLAVDFGPGVTCIVGPNGCGKSNVSEAVRWVLGEQNARRLRANGMQDLIFNGTASRKAEGMCEVRLLFDNEEGGIGVPFAEVEIGRRLYRSGDSEYLLNREAVRLKDIQEIFTNTGIGTDSYSMLEQGKVDAILRAKPIDRREIFEEAAGITKFRMRQEETVRKLKRTAQDLQRIQDIVGELSRQVRSLKIQAGRAERYNQFHAELHQLELVRIERLHVQAEEKIRHAREEYARVLELKLSLEEKIRQSAPEVEQARADVEAARQRLNEGRTRKGGLEADIRRHDEILNHCRAMETELVTQGERTKELERTLLVERETVEGSIEEKEAASERLQQQLVDLEVEENLLSAQEAEGRSDFDKARRHAEELRRLASDREKALAALVREQENLERERAALEERETRLRATVEEATEELRSIDAKFDAVRVAREGHLADREREEIARQELNARLEELEKELEIQRSLNENLRGERSRLNHRLESLEELQAQHEGQGEGIKQAMQRKQRGEEPFTSLEGVLIEKVRVAAGYEDALENALSHWLESALCPTEEDAMRILEALRGGAKGRIACFPLSRIQGLPENSAGPDWWSRIEGARPAAEVVEIQPEFGPLLSPILSRTLIVPDLEGLRQALGELPEGWLAVTPQGEIATYPGFVTGGKVISSGFLKRRSEMEEIQKRLVSVQVDWEASEQELERLRAARKEVVDEMKSRETAIHDLVIRMAAKQEELQGLSQLRQKVERTLDSATQENERLISARQAVAEKAEGLKVNREDLEIEYSRAQESCTEAGVKLSRIEQALVEFQAAHRRHRESFIALQKDHERFLAEMQHARERRVMIEERLAQLRQEEEQRERKIWETLDKKNEAETALKGLFEQVDRAEADLSELDAGLNQQSESLRAAEEQTNQLRAMLETRGEESLRLEVENHRLALEMENIERRLVEELQSDWETCRRVAAEAGEVPESLEALGGVVAQLREKIAKIGDVNPLALEEYNEQKERLDFLTQQQEDLERARTSLQKTLSEVKRSARKQFLETFEKIRQNFNRTFRRMLGGGRADLLLLDEADIFASGVEIVAQPPGKKLQSITLMSGGEKTMTAIALLFSIYQVKASPFCFLDEVDAALDDANVDRFARLLIDYREQTQFIIVTHNKHTMAVADRLYGVTMERPGVSTVMSMEFERRSDYNLNPLPEVEDDQLPEIDYDAALAQAEVEDFEGTEGIAVLIETGEVEGELVEAS